MKYRLHDVFGLVLCGFGAFQRMVSARLVVMYALMLTTAVLYRDETMASSAYTCALAGQDTACLSTALVRM